MMSFDRPQVIYRIHQIETEWGSFGRMVLSGFFGDPNQDDDDEDNEDEVNYVEKEFEILRMGPFVPPFTFPSGHCVVDELSKRLLIEADFRGSRFTPVKIGKMVRRDWQHWSRSQEFDFSNFSDIEVYCPEDLILKPPGDETLLAGVGDYWRLDGEVAHFEWTETAEGNEAISWSNSEIGDNDFSCPSSSLVYVTPRVKTWIDERFSEWVGFESVPVLD